MTRLLIFITTIMLTISTMAQNDPLTITLSPFTKKQAQSEILYVAVFIKSNIPDSIEIDDSRSWINCVNAFGVKLITETLQDDCFKELDKSDCHPLYSNTEDYFSKVTKSKTLESYAEYSYIVEISYVVRTEETGLKRTLSNFNPFRFKLELPYKQGSQWSKATNKNWVYYSYPR